LSKEGKGVNITETENSELALFAKYSLIAEIANIYIYSQMKEFSIIFNRLFFLYDTSFDEFFSQADPADFLTKNKKVTIGKNMDKIKKSYNICPYCGAKQIWKAKRKLFSKQQPAIDIKYLPVFDLKLTDLSNDMKYLYNKFISEKSVLFMNNDVKGDFINPKITGDAIKQLLR
jgi:DNA-directed RNA polymerase subunit RPC12/RpoP